MTVTALTHDTGPSRAATGLVLAFASASTFGLSGVLARGLLDTGWSAGAAVALRVVIAAAVLFVPGLLALRGRWHLVRDNAGLITVYGVSAVAGAQLCYFYAVTYMQVSVALLLEYTAPVAVVIWLWLRHGHRPSGLTVLGAAIAARRAGAGARRDLRGRAEHRRASCGRSARWSGPRPTSSSPPTRATGCPASAWPPADCSSRAWSCSAAGALGVLPFTPPPPTPSTTGGAVAWWVPVLALGLVTAAFAYVTGIEAGRRLGSRLASFVALGEVLAALVFAWLLLGELPRPIQLVGGLLVLAGVVVVKLGEGRAPLVVEPLPGRRTESLSERPAA